MQEMACLEQTIRHSFIAVLLDIRHFIFCINKMDLTDYSESVFLGIKNDLTENGREAEDQRLAFHSDKRKIR